MILTQFPLWIVTQTPWILGWSSFPWMVSLDTPRSLCLIPHRELVGFPCPLVHPYFSGATRPAKGSRASAADCSFDVRMCFWGVRLSCGKRARGSPTLAGETDCTVHPNKDAEWRVPGVVVRLQEQSNEHRRRELLYK